MQTAIRRGIGLAVGVMVFRFLSLALGAVMLSSVGLLFAGHWRLALLLVLLTGLPIVVTTHCCRGR